MHHSFVYPGRQADIRKITVKYNILNLANILKKCITTLVKNHIKYSPLLITSNQILIC